MVHELHMMRYHPEGIHAGTSRHANHIERPIIQLHYTCLCIRSIHAGQAFSFSATGYTPPPANNFLVDEIDTGTPDQVSTDYTNFLYDSGEDNIYTLAAGCIPMTLKMQI